MAAVEPEVGCRSCGVSQFSVLSVYR